MSTVSTRNRPVDDEPQAPPMKSTAQSQFRARAGSLGPLHHPPGSRRRCRWNQAGVEVLVRGTSISSRTDTSRRYGSPVHSEIAALGSLTGLTCRQTSRSTSSSSDREPCGHCASPPSDTVGVQLPQGHSVGSGRSSGSASVPPARPRPRVKAGCCRAEGAGAEQAHTLAATYVKVDDVSRCASDWLIRPVGTGAHRRPPGPWPGRGRTRRSRPVGRRRRGRCRRGDRDRGTLPRPGRARPTGSG